MTNANGTGGVSAPVTIVMAGSSRDASTDRAAADMVGKAAAEYVERVIMAVKNREMRPG